MIHSRSVGAARITSILEYAAPTHDPAFLFPDLKQAELDAMASRLTPHHYIPSMNRLIVSVRLWLVQMAGKTILIDTGVGNLKPRAAARMNMLNNRVEEWLSAAGASPETVSHVVLTHLHMDHTGWNTIRDDKGGWKPTFPNARYIVPAREYSHYEQKLAQGPDAIMDESWNDSVVPVREAGLLDLLPDDADRVADVLRPDRVPGHTPGMTGYHLETGDGTVFFCGDVFHSLVQIYRPDINTAYCALPDVARETRSRVLAEAAASQTLLCPMHFGSPHCGYVRRDAEGYSFEGASWPSLTLPGA